MIKYSWMSSAAVVIGTLRFNIKQPKMELLSYPNVDLTTWHMCNYLSLADLDNISKSAASVTILISEPTIIPNILCYMVYNVPVMMEYRCVH